MCVYVYVCVCVCVFVCGLTANSGVTAGSEMAASTAATTVLPPVKSVMVYRNGDPFYNGRRFVVNQRQVTTMEAFLNEVTQNIGAPLAVRTLYTPRQGTRVSELQDLQTGAQYVAAGFERFKKLDYLNVGAKKQPAARKETQAKVTQRPTVSAKWRKFIPVPCIIHVFRNGDLLCPPFRFIIPRSMQQDLEQILSLVTEKVSLRTGAVRRLCSLEGATVSSAGELETGRCYVAVGTERFKKLPYVELLVSKATERYYPGKRRLLRRNENRKAGSGPEDQYSDSALLDSPESDGRRVKSTGDEAALPQATQQRSRRQGADETSAFFARPVKIRKNRGLTRLPLSSGSVQPSVFKRAARKRREEVRGAEEVQEDENTATELPVDQRVAEVVEDEELHNTDDPLHSTKQAQSSEQSGVERTKGSARTDKSAAEILEPEQKHPPSTSRPSSSTSQGKNKEEKDGPQDILSNTVEQNHHQDDW
ncbi:doublecortin domain-containing protein 2B isoform X2 [Trachinotus anak]|uniref:doublecortin domain-containing protein 2B isoform X2 n=1 Tax=Trachinotus anak TaxID=443729 RepID=UPI0039F25624